MKQMKIDNWLVTEEGIQWNGNPKIDYFISKERLDELGTNERSNMYDWLLHTASKTWITKADIYTLNTAFIYAIEYFGLDYNTGSFIETLKEQQYEIMNK